MCAYFVHTLVFFLNINLFTYQKKGMWDELNVYQLLSTDLQKQQKYREEFRVAKFLSGLKSDLDPIRSQILSGKDIPTVRETYVLASRF